MAPAKKGLVERLRGGERVLVAEGYVFEFERKGYLKAGPFVPEVVLQHPDLVKALHEEYVHAGSDVVQAFTYYATRQKLRVIGREGELEELNRRALRIAKDVADRTRTLFAGSLSNTTAYVADDPKTHDFARQMFKEQTLWAVQEGVDYIVAETIPDLGEALLALEAVKQYGNGVPAVITLYPNMAMVTKDGHDLSEALRALLDRGATVAGINCSVGPVGMGKILRAVRKEIPSHPTGFLGALPVPYRTSEKEEFIFLTNPDTGKLAFPRGLDYFNCSDDDVTDFGQTCAELDIPYFGLCCGNSSRYFRYLAESVGRTPPASKYSPDMSKHWIYGNHESQVSANTEMLRTHWNPRTAKS